MSQFSAAMKLIPIMPWIPPGGHLDDWLEAKDFILSEAILLGDPQISQTTESILVAARAEVNASVDLRTAPTFISYST